MADEAYVSDSLKSRNTANIADSEEENSVVGQKGKAQTQSPAPTTVSKGKTKLLKSTTTVKPHGEGSSSVLKASTQDKKVARAEEDDNYVPPQELKSAIKKLWSEEDELTLLKVFKELKNKSDMNAFYDAVRGLLKRKRSKNQVTLKIGELRNKFTCDHQRKLYKLSEQIWGGSNPGGKRTKKSKKGKEDFYFDSEFPRVSESVNDLFPGGYMTEDGKEVATEDGKEVARELLEMIPLEELGKLEIEWLQYHLEEMERDERRLKLQRKQMELVLKGMELRGFKFKKP